GAAVELGRRVAAAKNLSRPPRVQSGEGGDSWAPAQLAPPEHEELWGLAPDGTKRLRAAPRGAMGGLHALHVSPRDPLRVALREGASAFVLVHNHPSGDPTPSEQDIEFSRRIAVGGELVGTPLLDHVVVARDGYVSLLDQGLLPEPNPNASA